VRIINILHDESAGVEIRSAGQFSHGARFTTALKGRTPAGKSRDGGGQNLHAHGLNARGHGNLHGNHMGKAWNDMFGASPWTFDMKGVRVIGLDTVSREKYSLSLIP